MADTLRELIVMLSLDSDNFSRNLRTIQKQVREAESAFTLAGAGVEGFEKSITGTQAKLDLMKQKVELQKQAVTQYTGALAAAKQKLADSQAQQALYTTRLADAKARQQELSAKVNEATQAFQRSASAVGMQNASTQQIADSLARLKDRYSSLGNDILRVQSMWVSNQSTLNAQKASNESLRTSIANLSVEYANVGAEIARLQGEYAKQTAGPFGASGAGAQKTAARIDALKQRYAELGDAIINNQIALEQGIAAESKQQEKVDKLSASLATMQQKYEALESTIKNTEDAMVASKQLDELKQSYGEASEEVKKLEGQLENIKKTVQNSYDAVHTATTNLNKAKAALAETEAGIKKLTLELNTMKSKWTQAGNTLVAFGKKCTDAGKKLSTTGKTLTRTITTPLMALGAAAIKASISYESAFTSVRKTVDATEAEFSKLSDTIKGMSTKYATSAANIAEVVATAGQLGIANDSLTGFARTMIDLGNSTDIVANDAASTLAKFANITEMNQSQFSNLGSALVDLGNNYAATESDIMEMSKRLAGAGHQVGLTEAQILGFATALSAVGIEAQMGGSAFSKVLTKMEVASETGGQALTDFATVAGLTAEQFKAIWDVDPATAFQAFIVGLSKLDDEGESAIVTLQEMGISEIRLRDTLLRSVNATELFTNTQATATKAWAENTALSVEAGKRYATTESKLQNLKNTAALWGMQIGDDLNPKIDELTNKATEALESFMQMDAGQRQNVVTAATWAAAAGPVLLGLGKITEGVGKASGKIGDFSKWMGKMSGIYNTAGGGVKGFTTALLSSKAAVAALAIAVGYGTYKLIDYASGAKEAREALERLNETAETWKNTNATTSFEKAQGLDAFGLSSSDFGFSDSGASTWISDVRTLWNDGKRETDEIINDTVKTFTDGSDKIRKGIIGVKDSGGMSEALGTTDEDLARLGEIDSEVEKLLKKRQNKTLTKDDEKKLQALYDEREAIRIRYKLVEDTQGGYDDIAKGVESALSRNAQSGDVWSNAYAAATQGVGAFTQALNEEYDAQYKEISAMEESEEKQKKLLELKKWYNEQTQAGAEAYYKSLKDSAEQTGAFESDGKYGDTIEQLSGVSDLIDKVSKGEASETDLANALSGMDETNVVEVTAALTDMQNAAQQAGETLPDNLQGVLDTIENIKTAYETTGAVFSENVTDSLKTMFGEGADAEVYEIHAALNAQSLDASYDAWAAGTHADIIPAIDPSKLTIDATGIRIDGLTGHVTVVTGDNKTLPIEKLNLEPQTGQVTGMTTDGNLITIANLNLNPATGYVTAMTADGNLLQIKDLKLNPETGHVDAVTADEKSLDITELNLNPATGTVDAMTAYDQVLTIGHLSLKPETGQVTAMDAKKKLITIENLVLNPETGHVTAVTADDKTLDIQDLTLNELEGTVTAVTSSGENLTISIPEIDSLKGTLLSIVEGDNVEKPVIQLKGEITEVTPAPEDQYSSSRRPDLEYNSGKSSVDKGGDSWITTSQSEAVNDYAEALKNYEEAQKAYESGDPATDDMFLLSQAVFGAQEALNVCAQDFQMFAEKGESAATAAQYIANGLQQLKDGNLGEKDTAELQKFIDSVNTILSSNDYSGYGAKFAQQLSDGLTGYGWTVDASTVAASIKTAIDAALGVNSPATAMIPTGSSVSEGIAEGMTGFGFNPAGSGVTSNVKSSVSKLPSQGVLTGQNFARGLANGITSGTDWIREAARKAALEAKTAADAALEVSSPSRVGKRIGAFFTKGIALGIEDEKQVKAIRNASRFIGSTMSQTSYNSAPNDNRRTYNQDQSVTVNVSDLAVQDAQDVRALALEIDAIRKRAKRGKGGLAFG